MRGIEFECGEVQPAAAGEAHQLQHAEGVQSLDRARVDARQVFRRIAQQLADRVRVRQGPAPAQAPRPACRGSASALGGWRLALAFMRAQAYATRRRRGEGRPPPCDAFAHANRCRHCRLRRAHRVRGRTRRTPAATAPPRSARRARSTRWRRSSGWNASRGRTRPGSSCPSATRRARPANPTPPA